MISTALVLFATLFRIVPHLPNTAPIGATAVLAGRTLSKKKAISLVLFSMIFSDLLLSKINGYPFFTLSTGFIYLGFVIQVLLASRLKTIRGGSFFAAALGATLFFITSNFGVWIEGLLYNRTWDGLVQCFVMALPFYKLTLLGDIAWTGFLVGAYKVLSERFSTQTTISPAF